MMRTLLLAVLLCVPAGAQTAQVIQLTPDEAAQAKALYAEGDGRMTGLSMSALTGGKQ